MAEKYDWEANGWERAGIGYSKTFDSYEAFLAHLTPEDRADWHDEPKTSMTIQFGEWNEQEKRLDVLSVEYP